jgi:hypothetical protein
MIPYGRAAAFLQPLFASGPKRLIKALADNSTGIYQLFGPNMV